MATLEIPANTTVASPSEINVDLYPVENSADRNTLGVRLIDRIAIKRRLVLKWRYLTGASLATLLTNTNGATFTVKYSDPQDNAQKTITCRRETVNTGILMYKAGVPLWGNVTMTLDEQ